MAHYTYKYCCVTATILYKEKSTSKYKQHYIQTYTHTYLHIYKSKYSCIDTYIQTSLQISLSFRFLCKNIIMMMLLLFFVVDDDDWDCDGSNDPPTVCLSVCLLDGWIVSRLFSSFLLVYILSFIYHDLQAHVDRHSLRTWIFFCCFFPFLYFFFLFYCNFFNIIFILANNYNNLWLGKYTGVNFWGA